MRGGQSRAVAGEYNVRQRQRDWSAWDEDRYQDDREADDLAWTGSVAKMDVEPEPQRVDLASKETKRRRRREEKKKARKEVKKDARRKEKVPQIPLPTRMLCWDFCSGKMGMMVMKRWLVVLRKLVERQRKLAQVFWRRKCEEVMTGASLPPHPLPSLAKCNSPSPALLLVHTFRWFEPSHVFKPSC